MGNLKVTLSKVDERNDPYSNSKFKRQELAPGKIFTLSSPNANYI